jgi:hypothetical protein
MWDVVTHCATRMSYNTFTLSTHRPKLLAYLDILNGVIQKCILEQTIYAGVECSSYLWYTYLSVMMPHTDKPTMHCNEFLKV